MLPEASARQQMAPTVASLPLTIVRITSADIFLWALATWFLVGLPIVFWSAWRWAVPKPRRVLDVSGPPLLTASGGATWTIGRLVDWHASYPFVTLRVSQMGCALGHPVGFGRDSYLHGSSGGPT